LLSLLISNAVRYRLTAKIPPLANCVVTGVPGSPEKISFDGNDLIYMHGSPPLVEGLGLILGIFGYDENIQISLTSCRRMVPDKALLMACLQHSFKELKKDVDKSAAARRAAAPKTAPGKKRSTALRKPRSASARAQAAAATGKAESLQDPGMTH
jgi:diacylglycerol O-acyltransferase / wax synthase